MIIEAIAGKFHFRLKDRVSAAGILAESLKAHISGSPDGNSLTIQSFTGTSYHLTRRGECLYGPIFKLPYEHGPLSVRELLSKGK